MADGLMALTPRDRGTRDLYGGRGGKFFQDMLSADDVEDRGGGFRWMLSTSLAAAVGAIAILVVVHGSSRDSMQASLLPAIEDLRDGIATAAVVPAYKNADGLKWATPKADRLRLTSGSLSTRYIIHESSKSRRDGREYVRQKPYARIVARLAPVPPGAEERIPKFNPFKLYAANNTPAGQTDPDDKAGSGLSRPQVQVKIVELLGGILPEEDGAELDVREVQDLVERSASTPALPNLKGQAREGDGDGAPLDGIGGLDVSADAMSNGDWLSGQKKNGTSSLTGNVTSVSKLADSDDDEFGDIEDGEVRVVVVGRNDTLASILKDAGAPAWQVRAMIEAAQNIFPEAALVPGQQVRITVVSSLTDPDQREPARFSVFSDGHDHLVTVTRNTAGEFVASAQPIMADEFRRIANGEFDNPRNVTVYAALYHAALSQSVPEETIQQVLSLNAVDTDFRRKVRPGDTVELFFDMKNNQSTDGPPGELLYTAIGSAGAMKKFYRFRTPDGRVDFYDEDGYNSRRFLLRKPVRAEDVRLTSGFGMRYHPLLNSRKMHTGIDWACDPGTPVLAAGNGTIEEIGRKGYYGNYIRIRHANGYHTTYGHMRKFASGLSPGMKVRQGQVIGYVGSTGLSSGPHLHFEVLVNSRFINPMSIQGQRETKLEGSDLAAFKSEYERIDDLMRRAPVMTANK